MTILRFKSVALLMLIPVDQSSLIWIYRVMQLIISLALTAQNQQQVKSAKPNLNKLFYVNHKKVTRLSFSILLAKSCKIWQLHHHWALSLSLEKWWNVCLTITSKSISNMVRDKNSPVLRHAMTILHTLGKTAKKMTSHLQFSISVTRWILRERDASCTPTKLSSTSRMLHYHHCLNLKSMQEFNLRVWTQRWLFFQEIRSRLDLSLITQTKRRLDSNLKSIAQTCHLQLEKDINWAMVSLDFHVMTEKLLIPSHVLTMLSIAQTQTIEFFSLFRVQETFMSLTKHALNSCQNTKTGVTTKNYLKLTSPSSLKHLKMLMERQRVSKWIMLLSETSLELLCKSKDGSNSSSKSGGECTQMSQDAMLVFTWFHQLQSVTSYVTALNAC